MNVYDFDETILEGDTEEYFYDYVIKNNLLTHSKLLKLAKLNKKRLSKHKFYESMNKYYKFIAKNIKNLDKVVDDFWDKYDKKIKKFYFKTRKTNDIISTATPSFLLLPIFKKLKIKEYIASEFDFKTYKFKNDLNYGKNKAIKFIEKYGEAQIDKFYSDSDTDIYLARLAKTPIKVVGNKLEKWDVNN